MPEIVPECRNSPCGCDLADLIQLAQNIMEFLIYFGTVILVLLLVYVGYLYVTNPTNPSNRSKARSVAMTGVIGFVIVLGGFLIVDTLINTFAKDEFGNWNNILRSERTECQMNVYEQTPPPDIIRTDDSPLATRIDIMCAAASANGLRAVYEVRGEGERMALRDEGVSCAIQVVPQISANHFSVYGPQGCQPEVTEVSCPDCQTVPGVVFKDGNQVAASYAARLIGFKNTVADLQEQNNVTFGWRVTEAFPPTANHFCGCHRNGTCTDINFF